jgi:hypothetical protein
MAIFQIITNVDLDNEVASDIEMMRMLKLEHYQGIIANPKAVQEKLIKAGFSSDVSEIEVLGEAMSKITELEIRLSNPNAIYEDELEVYLSSLSSR